MKYAFLLYDDENAFDAMPDGERFALIERYTAYTASLRAAEAFVAGEPLDHTRGAKRVRGATVEDGPFTDAKEQLGGFYVVEAENLDTALDWASKCPCALTGTIEIRPVWDPQF